MNEYDPPIIGTIIPLSSNFAEDAKLHFIKTIASVLEANGLIASNLDDTCATPALRIKLSDYEEKSARRKYSDHWVDGGKSIAIFHPNTCLPFFLNKSGSVTCRFCNGRKKIKEIISYFNKKWPTTANEVIVKDLLKFLLLLEELDLIEFTS